MIIQPDLFEQPASVQCQRNHLGVKGLAYFPDLLTTADQARVLKDVDAGIWHDDLKRRVQHYGYKYNYKARTIDHSMYVGPLPAFAVAVAQRLITAGAMEEMPDQLIVNEYQPGQGITAHVDCEPCFKNTIVTVSLGSTCEMDFIEVETGEMRSVRLDPGSALVLRDEARHEWMHRILARKNDHGIPRKRRVSLTFRNVILNTQ